MLNVCGAGKIASAGAKAQIVTPADTLDDTDADANIENEARDSTLPLRPLMCVAVRPVSSSLWI
jgi:hypothetical protein